MAINCIHSIFLLFTAQGLPSLGSQCVASPIQEPEKCARHNGTTDDISQCDGYYGVVNELANTEVSPIEHTNWNQKEVGNGVLVAQCYAAKIVS